MKIKYILNFFATSSLVFANTVGIAGLHGSTLYHGENKLTVLPIVQIEHKNFYLKNYKAGWYFYQEPNFKASILFNPLGGYTDFAIDKKQLKDGYKDISKRNTQFMGGIAFDFKLDNRTVGHGEYLFGQYGSTGELKMNQVYKVHDRFTLLPGVSFHYYDAKYMNHYIGIKKEEVQKNKNIKKEFCGKDTISAGVNTTLEITFTEQATVSVFGGYEIYSTDIKKSDLIKNNKQPYIGVGIRYSF